MRRRLASGVAILFLTSAIATAVGTGPAAAQIGDPGSPATGGPAAGTVGEPLPGGAAAACPSISLASGAWPVTIDRSGPVRNEGNPPPWPVYDTVPGSSWITGTSSGVAGLNLPSALTFRVTFVLPDSFIDGAISGSALADDAVTIRLNSQVIASNSLSMPHYNFPALAFSASGQPALVPGTNSLEFEVFNAPGGNLNPIGLDFLADVSYCPAGWIEICKDVSGPGFPTYSFTIAGRPGVINVPNGACSLPIQVVAGQVTITEVLRPFMTLLDVYTIPFGRVSGKDLGNGTATIEVPEGDISEQTRVHFLDRHETGQLKICKATGPGVPPGMPFLITAGSQEYAVQAGSCVEDGFFAIGSQVLVDEVVPDGYGVTDIEVTPADRGGAKDLGTGSVVVTVGTGVTEITYFNQSEGTLEICKISQKGKGVLGYVDGETFDFHVSPLDRLFTAIAKRSDPTFVPGENANCVSVGKFATGTQLTIEEIYRTKREVTNITLRGGNAISLDEHARLAVFTIGQGFNQVLFVNRKCVICQTDKPAGIVAGPDGAGTPGTGVASASGVAGAAGEAASTNQVIEAFDVTPPPGSVVSQRLSVADLAIIGEMAQLASTGPGVSSGTILPALRRSLHLKSVDHSVVLCAPDALLDSSSVAVTVDGEAVAADVESAEEGACAVVEFASSHLPHDILERVFAADGSTSWDDLVDVVISARTAAGIAADISWSFFVRTQVNVPDGVALPQFLGSDRPALAATAPDGALATAAGAATTSASAQAQTGTAAAASAADQAEAAAVAPEAAASTPPSDRAADRAAQVASRDAERQAELADRQAARAKRGSDNDPDP